ncbi:MAG TPA: SUMF1/EgtB/PvdO family nonheme iron enzyme [Polyangiaceae bacterium]|jgi:formylglycine-generating enzyme required for sulfatase activity|nr:SUMF1/EgtB/PvdO family nonheme iron enzyme [Polyangiaceae bacterium]
MGHRAVVLVVVIAACAETPASELAKPPPFDPPDQTKCSVTKSQAEPLIVEWPSAARARLEAQLRRGAVVVRYSGCEMQLLAGCHAPARYAYVPITRKRDSVRIRNADELYANIPVYAARFEAELERSGELNVEMTIVGRWETDRASIHADELEGNCKDATHVLTGLTVGAFDFYSGADANVGAGAGVSQIGVGAKSHAKRHVLNRDGDATRCDASKIADAAPPDGCGAILRVEVVPVGVEKRVKSPEPSPSPVPVSEETPPLPAPEPKPGVSCPDGTKQNGSNCIPKSFNPCPPDRHLVLGGGCIADLPSASAVAPLSSPPRALKAGAVELKGGTFLMGSYDGQKDERPPRKVTVETFWMDVTEVTVKAYADCMSKGGCRAREFDAACNWGHPSRQDHPMNCVTWDEANDFCTWADKRLPTEEEWEYAARGTKGRRYPWGGETPMGRVCWKPLLSEGSTCAVGGYAAGATPQGILDLAGNVHEWTASIYCFTNEAGERKCQDQKHVHRGGSFENPHELFVRATTRNRHGSGAGISFGFRCADSER